jgi:hypothetical protein
MAPKRQQQPVQATAPDDADPQDPTDVDPQDPADVDPQDPAGADQDAPQDTPEDGDDSGAADAPDDADAAENADAADPEDGSDPEPAGDEDDTDAPPAVAGKATKGSKSKAALNGSKKPSSDAWAKTANGKAAKTSKTSKTGKQSKTAKTNGTDVAGPAQTGPASDDPYELANYHMKAHAGELFSKVPQARVAS